MNGLEKLAKTTRYEADDPAIQRAKEKYFERKLGKDWKHYFTRSEYKKVNIMLNDALQRRAKRRGVTHGVALGSLAATALSGGLLAPVALPVMLGSHFAGGVYGDMTDPSYKYIMEIMNEAIKRKKQGNYVS